MISRPVIYSLMNNADLQKFSYTTAQRDQYMKGKFALRNGERPRAIFCHVQEGSTISSLDWAINKPGDQNSYSATVQLDGSILFCIPEQHGPWTNGAVRSPKPVSKKLRDLGGNINNYTLSIEAEGYSTGAHPQKQIDSIYWLVRYWQDKYDIPDDWVFEHADVDNEQRSNCAGWYYDEIRKMIADNVPVALGNTSPPPTPTPGLEYPFGFDKSIATTLFGRVAAFDENGPVSKLWLSSGAKTAVFPALLAVITKGDRKLYQFSSGEIIEAKGGKVDWV
jgi:N-acetylmuramoyl-L-alanine amidase-like protein